MTTMKAVVFKGTGRIAVEEVPKPTPGVGEAVIRITTTTICGTDVHIVRGEYPVAPGLVLGHEPVGVVEALGPGLEGLYEIGERVIAGAITPCGQCFYCLNGVHSQCGGALGGWRFGHTINGAWAEYLLVPDARANLAPIPHGLTDEDVLLCPDIFSTGLAGAERGGITVGDAVAVFAQGPIGLCATLGSKLKGASLIVAIDAVPERLEVARRFGANVTLDARDGDPIAEIKRLTGGRGVDVAIEALGTQETFEKRAAGDSPRRDAVEPRRVLRQDRRAVRGVLRRAGRPEDRDHALPGRQGADAAADGDDRASPGGSVAACDASLRARRHRAGVRSLQPPAGRRAEGRAAADARRVRSVRARGGRGARRSVLSDRRSNDGTREACMETRKPVKAEPREMTTLDIGFPMLRRFARDFDWFFDRFGRERFALEPAENFWAPDVEMFEKDGQLFVRADLPGMKKEEVTVEVTDQGLTLKGERKREKEEKGENYYRTERSYGSFYRVIPLPDAAKFDQAKAVMRDGVLEVTMPVAKAEQKTTRLEIQEPATGEKKHAA